jgi:hypothetical protein
MQPTLGGTILEAEDVCDHSSLIDSKLKGFTGKGYVGGGQDHARQQLKWSYNASESGNYILEFRYTLNRNDVSPIALDINGKTVGDIEFWSTGNAGAWVWERVTVNLEKGVNTIGISPEKFVFLDHINIIKDGE